MLVAWFSPAPPCPPLPLSAAVGALTHDEVQVIQGALDLAGKTAEAVMTPLGKVGACWGVESGVDGAAG